MTSIILSNRFADEVSHRKYLPDNYPVSGECEDEFCATPMKLGSWHNCFGTYTWSDKNKYVGEWRNGTRHGEGTLTFSNGAKYVGKFRDGKFHGQGTATSANGDKYVGEFKDGKRNGQGTYTFAKSGNKYVGEWKEGKGHGQGTLTFANGNKYVGEFKDDKKNGQGTHIFASGEKHVGEYKDGKRNGSASILGPINPSKMGMEINMKVNSRMVNNTVKVLLFGCKWVYGTKSIGNLPRKNEEFKKEGNTLGSGTTENSMGKAPSHFCPRKQICR